MNITRPDGRRALGVGDPCPRCRSPLRLDTGMVDDARRAGWTGQVPVMALCVNGHSHRLEAPPPRRGHYVPICNVCELPCHELKERSKSARLYHKQCLSHSTYRTVAARNIPTRFAWVDLTSSSASG